MFIIFKFKGRPTPFTASFSVEEMLRFCRCFMDEIDTVTIRDFMPDLTQLTCNCFCHKTKAKEMTTD